MSKLSLKWWVFKMNIDHKFKRLFGKRDHDTGLKYYMLDSTKIYIVDTYDEFLKLPEDIGKKAEEMFGEEIFLMKEKAEGEENGTI